MIFALNSYILNLELADFAADEMATPAKGSILVTGANGGLGSAIVESIASSPELSSYHGLYAVRNAAHAPSLTSALAHSAKHSHDIVGLDLTKLDAVRKTAERINVGPTIQFEC